MPWPDVDRSRASWWAIGGLLGLALLFVLYSFVGTFVFGLFFYYATRPLYSRLRRFVRPPSLAAALSLFILALPVLILGAYALAIGLQELEQFAATTDLGPYRQFVEPYLDLSSMVENPSQLLDDPNLRASLESTLNSVLDSVGFVASALLHVFVMLVIAFYLLRDGPRLSRWARNRFADDRGVLVAYARAVDGDLKNIFSGNILNALLTGGLGAIVYSVLDLFGPPGLSIPYPALVGLLTGAASLVPVVGMKLVYFPVAGYLFADPLLAGNQSQLWFPVVFFVISFIIVDTIPDLVLRPYVSGRDLHLGMVMLAYIFGPLLFGWYGIFLGPILLVLLTHFARIILPELLAGEPIRPASIDPGANVGMSAVVDPSAVGDGPDGEPADPREGADGPAGDARRSDDPDAEGTGG